jgi:hypothetical protein
MDASQGTSPEARPDPIVQLRERLVEWGRSDLGEDVLRSAWDALSDLLSERVGSRISAGMSEAEQDEFNALIEAEEEGDDEGASTRWLERHCPHFRQIAEDEMVSVAAAAAEWLALNYPAETVLGAPRGTDA